MKDDGARSRRRRVVVVVGIRHCTYQSFPFAFHHKCESLLHYPRTERQQREPFVSEPSTSIISQLNSIWALLFNLKFMVSSRPAVAESKSMALGPLLPRSCSLSVYPLSISLLFTYLTTRNFRHTFLSLPSPSSLLSFHFSPQTETIVLCPPIGLKIPPPPPCLLPPSLISIPP